MHCQLFIAMAYATENGRRTTFDANALSIISLYSFCNTNRQYITTDMDAWSASALYARQNDN